MPMFPFDTGFVLLMRLVLADLMKWKQVFRQHLMEETVSYTERARLFRQKMRMKGGEPTLKKPGEI